MEKNPPKGVPCVVGGVGLFWFCYVRVGASARVCGGEVGVWDDGSVGVRESVWW